MQEEVKLLVGTSLQGEDQQFFIYRNSKLGEGGFGVVRKAFEAKNQNRPLAVKIIPYGGDPTKKAKIQKQIALLRVLPDHPNLVRVLPYKCFSENNFYIFMELCPDGTLSKYVKRDSGLLQEQMVFSIFYQLICGYRVLQQAGIVHQDLKLENVLEKNKVLKITDFGFSILAQNYKTSLTREGTLPYMSYEKLTDPNYKAQASSDVYSLGVMMFKIITKLHPYVNQVTKNQRQFVGALRASNLAKVKLHTAYSLQMHELFQLVTRMCAKSYKNRATCQQIYNFIDTNQIFAAYREHKTEPSVQLQLPPLPIKIEEISTPVFLPFEVQPQKQGQYIQKLSVEKQIRLQEAHNKNIEKVQNCILGNRLVLYLFDRLARRLIVEKAKEQLTGEAVLNYNRAILSCLVFEKRVTKQLMKYIKVPQLFPLQEIETFKKSEIGKLCLKLIKKDEEYTQENISDHLKRTHQVEVKDQMALLDIADQKDITILLKIVRKNLIECIKQRSCNVSQKRHLITLVYLFDSCTILGDYPKIQGLQLEQYFYKTETMNVAELTSKVMSQFNKEKTLPMPVFMVSQQENQEEWI